MAKYKLVEKHHIEHRNEYYELQIGPQTEQPHSLFFTTNEENLERVAAEIVAEKAPGQHWVLTPHRKDG
jgi:hypothetical protein